MTLSNEEFEAELFHMLHIYRHNHDVLPCPHRGDCPHEKWDYQVDMVSPDGETVISFVTEGNSPDLPVKCFHYLHENSGTIAILTAEEADILCQIEGE